MLIGIDTSQRIDFISDYDKTEPKTVFKFKPLSGLDMIEVTSGTELDLIKYLSRSVVEISGVEDKDVFISSLPANVVGELIKKANEINKLTGQEEKNF